MALIAMYRKSKKEVFALFPYELNENQECKYFNGKKWEYVDYESYIADSQPAYFEDFKHIKLKLWSAHKMNPRVTAHRRKSVLLQIQNENK